MKKTEETNEVKISGTILEELKREYTVWGEVYRTKINVKRRSKAKDRIEILIPKKLLMKEEILSKFKPGSWIRIRGSLRTQDVPNAYGSKSLRLFIYVSKIERILVDNIPLINQEDMNRVYIDGYLCKEPFFKNTNGGFKVTKLDIAVNREPHQTDYIPVIVWDRLAKFSKTLKVGAHVQAYGRIQSRWYFKFYNKETRYVNFSQLTQQEINKLGVWKETWELSIYKMKVVSW